MSADLFADWKKEEEYGGSSGGLGGGLYESPYGATSDAYGGDNSSNDDFEFETVGDEAQSKDKEDEKPMFEVREHGLKVSRRKGFTLCCMAVGNGVLAMGSQEGMLLRCTTDATDSSGTIEEIMIEPRVAMANVFIDPTGTHVLISMENGSNFYLPTASTRPKKIMKAQSLKFTTVAWDRQSGTPDTSEPVLIGTDAGTVFEAEFDAGKEKAFKKVFQIANQGPIAGINFEHWTLPSGDVRYYVMLTTSASGKKPTRMFQFIGSGTHGFEPLFKEYTNPEKLRFQELPGDGASAVLRFYANQERERAKGFGILTGDGVYHGDFVFGLSSTVDNVVSGTELLAYPEKGTKPRTPPLSLAMTPYHVVLLYPRLVQVVSKLNHVVVLEEPFDARVGTGQGLTVDEASQTVWIHSTRRLLELVVVDEDRHVWKLYLSKAMVGPGDDRDFDRALSVCRTGYERQRVWTAQADKLFAQREFDRAAVLYAKTSRSFEAVALQFLDHALHDAVLVFLVQKLKGLSLDDKTQRTVLCSWIVELFLDKFTVLKGSAQDVDAHANLLFEFKQFLQDHKRHLDPATTFNLIASHGRPDELVFYATLIEDYEKVMTYHVDRGEYGAAIELLRSVETSKVEALWYKYAPELIVHRPKEVYEAWVEAATLNPTRLIPSIVRHVHQTNGPVDARGHPSKTRAVLDMAIRFLKFAIKQGNRDPTIHNYLLFLLAKHPDERLLISFLRKTHKGKHVFDIAFALRLCTQHEKNRACIYIYAAMGLFQDAVEKALQVDVKIAKEMANRPDDDETRQKLWTLIAKHTIDAGGEIKDAMHLLKESALLKIEDLLPFFPDFVLINEFKKEISESLEVYNARIDHLKEEMQDYTHSAELIRADMQQLRKRCALVSGNQRCELTGQTLLGHEFYLFPCSHAFHATALRLEMQKHHNSFQRQTVKQLLQTLTDLSTDLPARTPFFQRPLAALPFLNLSSSEKDVMTPGHDGGDGTTAAAKEHALAQERELVQQKLDDMIASECIFCGEVMIKSLHTPFISIEDDWMEGQEWAI